MARVTFKAGQPIQSLSGTIGNLTYRTINGKTFVAAAIQARAGIRAAMKRYYEQFSTETGSRLKLQAKMLEAYRNRRQKQDLGSTRVGNESNKK